MGIIEIIKNKEDFVALKNVDDKVIDDLQNDLKVEINEEYKKCIKEFGAFSFNGHEFLGICDSKRLCIKDVTIETRNEIRNFSKELYIIENLDIDDVKIAQNSKGEIYSINAKGKIKKEFDSFKEYINEI